MPRYRKRKPMGFNKVFKPFLKKVEEHSGKFNTTRAFQDQLRELLRGAVTLIKGDKDCIRLIPHVDLSFKMMMEFGETVVAVKDRKPTPKANVFQKELAACVDLRFADDLVPLHPQGQKKIAKYQRRIDRLRSFSNEFCRQHGMKQDDFFDWMTDEAEKVVGG